MSAGDAVEFIRDCDAIEIPSGVFTVVRRGTKGTIAQTLGGSFTVQDDAGKLLRVDGNDADAIGMPVPEEARIPATAAPGPDGGVSEELLLDTMKTCYDPEIPVNIVDLGLIYEHRIEPHPQGGSKVSVKMSLTAPGCGMSDVLKADLESKIRRLPGVTEVQVEVVFDPPWDPSRMSDAARVQLNVW